MLYTALRFNPANPKNTWRIVHFNDNSYYLETLIDKVNDTLGFKKKSLKNAEFYIYPGSFDETDVFDEEWKLNVSVLPEPTAKGAVWAQGKMREWLVDGTWVEWF